MKFTVKTKIIIQCTIILLLLIGMATQSFIRIRAINKNLTIINDINITKQRYAINFRGAVHDRAIRLGDFILYTDINTKNTTVSEINELAVFYQESATALDKITAETDSSSDELQKLADIKKSEQETLPLIAEIIRLESDGLDTEAISVHLEKARPAFNLWLDRINAYIDLQESNNQIITDKTREQVQYFEFTLIIIGIVSISIAVLLSIVIVRSIRPLEQVANSLNDIAQGSGDLTAHLTVKTDDEIGTVARSFNTVISTLHTIMSTIKKSVQTLSVEGSQLLTNTKDVQTQVANIDTNIINIQAQIKNQAEKVSDVSLTMKNIDSNIQTLNSIINNQAQDITDCARDMKEMVSGINEVEQILEKNTEQFSRLTSASAIGYENISNIYQKVIEISDKSQGVSDANNIINSLASQTNLLAMNAAIEAAHAGDAGRGFAVVADEIRKLAENSSKQSKTISIALKDLIESISMMVETSQSAGESFENVMEAVSSVTEQQAKVHTVMVHQVDLNQKVSGAFSNINQINTTVLGKAEQITGNSKQILQKTIELDEITRDVNLAINTISDAAKEIQTTIQNMNRSTEITEQDIITVQNQVEQFTL